MKVVQPPGLDPGARIILDNRHTRLPLAGYRIHTKPARNSPPPLWGRAGRGAPGIGLSVEAGPPCISRRGKAHVDPSGPAPAADGL